MTPTTSATVTPQPDRGRVHLALIRVGAHAGATFTPRDARTLAASMRRNPGAQMKIGRQSFAIDSATLADQLDRMAAHVAAIAPLRQGGTVPIEAPRTVTVAPDNEYGRLTLRVAIGEYSRTHTLAYAEALAIADSLDKGTTKFNVATPYGTQVLTPDTASARRIAGELRATVRKVKNKRFRDVAYLR